MKKIAKYVKRPSLIIMYLMNKGLFNFISDKMYIKIAYRINLGKKLNLSNPQLFNEKLQWLKLYDRKDVYTTMVDKYEAKKYVAGIIGDEYIIPTFGVYDRFDDIDFDKLPSQFVIKCTHDCGGLVIVKDKLSFDIDSAKQKINKSLKRNYYYHGREWPYKNVKPRIIIEKYMEDDIYHELRDYKFFCFNGKVKFFKIDFNRFVNHAANYYDVNGNLLHFGEIKCPPNYNEKLKMPKKLKEMISVAEKLSKGLVFIRVDLYEVNSKIYFGELTFSPNCGFGKFNPEEYDLKIGKMLEINAFKSGGR